MSEPRPSSAPRLSLVLYTRSGCPLCDEMEAELARAGRAARYELRKVDIDGDPALRDRFGMTVPVLEIAGEVAFEGHLAADTFRERFDRIADRIH